MSDVHAALSKRFQSPEWILLTEVRDDAGWRGSRSADAVAMNTWPSRGLQIHGVEIKRSRSDWLRELKDPAKSAPVQSYCDFWWLAAGDEKVAKLEEIPLAWGFLVLRGKSLVQVKAAPELKPEAPDRGFMAMMLRNATKGTTPLANVEAMVQERVERRLNGDAIHQAGELDMVKHALAELTQRVVDFEKSSGIRINNKHDWGDIRDPKKVGAMVKVLLGGAFGPRALRNAKSLIDGMSEELARAIEMVGSLLPIEKETDDAQDEEAVTET